MGVLISEEVVSSKVAPARLFKGMCKDHHKLVPKVAPQFVKSAFIIRGDGGVGSINQVNFVDDAPFPYVRYKIDELDEAQFTFKYSLIEGRELGEIIKGISFESKFEPTANGGCLMTVKRVITIAEGAKLKPDELEVLKVRSNMIFGQVEAYLLQNPDVYT